MLTKRKLDVAVISDVHLGTYGSQAEPLLRYLRSIDPKVLILNGDIVDIWQLSKSYFPQTHWFVIKEILSMVGRGVETYYITGNHDELVRKLADAHFGNFHIVNKLVLELHGKKAWFFHGDVFDVTMQHSKWLAKLGAKGYGMLILLNKMANALSQLLGKGKISLSKRIKQEVSNKLKAKANFEQTAADLAISKGYSFVACGHIHQACITRLHNNEGQVVYLNSGDWVESLTALEYSAEAWSLYEFNKDLRMNMPAEAAETSDFLSDKRIFDGILHEVVHD